MVFPGEETIPLNEFWENPAAAEAVAPAWQGMWSGRENEAGRDCERQPTE